MAVSLQAVEAALAKVVDPEINRPMVELGMIRDVEIDGDNVSLGVDLTTAACPLKSKIEQDVRDAATSAGAKEVTIHWGVKPIKREVAKDDPCPGVQNIVLVVSGKGGVGKSTVATNVAMSLKRAGCRVGLLDADMYGPSIPTMLGVMGRPGANEQGRIKPLERFGVKLMSIGFMLESDKTAVIWRGPMLQGALLQFLKDVEWGELDYLVLDLPPGTGDIIHAVRHMKLINSQIEELAGLGEWDLASYAEKLNAPRDLVKQVAKDGRLPVPNFAAGGIATPADAAMMMRLGAEAVFVGSGILKSSPDPEKQSAVARAIVEAVTHFDNPAELVRISQNVDVAMRGEDTAEIPEEKLLQSRGW